MQVGPLFWLLACLIFGVMLPFLAANGAIKIWDSFHRNSAEQRTRLGVARSYLLGVVIVIPVYASSYAYMAMVK